MKDEEFKIVKSFMEQGYYEDEYEEVRRIDLLINELVKLEAHCS